MISWANDDELFEIMKTELYTAVVGDILDTMHYYHQFLPQKIQPMSENMIVAGRNRYRRTKPGSHFQAVLPGGSGARCGGHRNRPVPGPGDYHHAGRVHPCIVRS